MTLQRALELLGTRLWSNQDLMDWFSCKPTKASQIRQEIISSVKNAVDHSNIKRVKRDAVFEYCNTDWDIEYGRILKVIHASEQLTDSKEKN